MSCVIGPLNIWFIAHHMSTSLLQPTLHLICFYFLFVRVEIKSCLLNTRWLTGHVKYMVYDTKHVTQRLYYVQHHPIL